MSIKRKIRFKNTPVFVNEDEEYCEDLAKSFKGEKDRPRYEEQSEEELQLESLLLEMIKELSAISWLIMV